MLDIILILFLSFVPPDMLVVDGPGCGGGGTCGGDGPVSTLVADGPGCGGGGTCGGDGPVSMVV